MALTQESLNFLAENRMRDDRLWFQENRKRFVTLVQEPLAQLAGRMGPAMLEIDPLLVVEPKVGKTLSRVWRDTRFSKDKALFRETMWCNFSRRRQGEEAPAGFFFEFSPNGYRWGCGYYQASGAVMREIRQLVVGDDKVYLHAQKALELHPEISLQGDRYKRTRNPDQTEEKKQWLDRKNVFCMREGSDLSRLFSEQLADDLMEGFRAMAPAYALFRRAEDLVLAESEAARGERQLP